MNCPKCDAIVPEGSNFCENCGAPLSPVNSDKPEATIQRPQPPPPPGATSPPQPPEPPPTVGPSMGDTRPGPSTPGAATRFPSAPAPYQRPVSGPRTDPLAVAALAVGIGALVFMWAPFFAIVVGIAGAVLGLVAMNRIKAQPQELTGRGMAVAGLICGAVGAALNVLFIVVIWGIFTASRVYY